MALTHDGAAGAPTMDAPGPLGHLVEQLWAPALATGRVRLDLHEHPGPGWREVESYVVVPSVRRATLLLPHHPRAATVGALTNYRGLRRRLPNAQRGVLGAAARAGLPLPFPRLTISTPTADDGAGAPLFLSQLADQLGHEALFASIGVRSGANRKATLQLVDGTGAPRGFAKLGWNTATSTGVRREQEALAAARSSGGACAPRLLACGELAGRPYVVTEPLPLASRGVRADVPPPSPQELFELCPLVRRSRIAETAQFRAVRDRVSSTSYDAACGSTLELARDLLDSIGRDHVEVPVAARWHGDLTPWNCARDGVGRLWVWDWECSEADAAAGLDALHWHVTTRTEGGRALGGAVLREAHAAARGVLLAAGVPRSAHARVTALYAVTLAERACDWATAAGWEHEFAMPHQLVDLVTSARLLVESER